MGFSSFGQVQAPNIRYEATTTITERDPEASKIRWSDPPKFRTGTDISHLIGPALQSSRHPILVESTLAGNHTLSFSHEKPFGETCVVCACSDYNGAKHLFKKKSLWTKLFAPFGVVTHILLQCTIK